MTSSLWRFSNAFALLNLAFILLPAVAGAQSPVYLTQWGSFGSGNGQFDSPAGVATDAAGYVFVVDAGNRRVQKFTGSGAYVTQWDSSSSGDNQFFQAFGVATNAVGNVYVGDGMTHRIREFTGTGTYLTEWGSFGSGDGQFNFPAGIATDAAGDVYVVDYGNNRIEKFTGTGAYLAQWGSLGSGNGQFNNPTTVATDAAGNVYVSDRFNQRIQKFSGTGTYLAQWGSPGSGDGQFDDPNGVTTDAAGNVYVADRNNNRIQKFTGSGTYLAQWGSFGSGDGEFNGPSTLATDGAGNVFVVDWHNNRIQKFGAQAAGLEVAVELDPNVINLSSHALWLTAYIEPSGFAPTSIDFSTVRLAGSVSAAPKFAVVGDHNGNWISDVTVKFSRSALDPLLTLGVNSLELTGSLMTGESFVGTDQVRVIDNGGQAASVAPNPLNPSGMLSFKTVKPGHVSVTMFDLQGRLVRRLMEMPNLPAGEHEVRIDGWGDRGEALPSGVYFYRMDAPDGTVTGRLAILK